MLLIKALSNNKPQEGMGLQMPYFLNGGKYVNVYISNASLW